MSEQKKELPIYKQKSFRSDHYGGFIEKLDKSTPLHKCMTRKDMFGTVCMFEIEAPTSYSMTKIAIREVFMSIRGSTLARSNYSYIDPKLVESSSEIDIIDLSVVDQSMVQNTSLPTLGAVNTMVGLYISRDLESTECDRYYIIIKNYDTFGQLVHLNQQTRNMELSKFVDSKLHKDIKWDTIVNSSLIVKEIAERCKLKFKRNEESVIIYKDPNLAFDVVLPDITNNYNDFGMISDSNQTTYVFYNGVYNIGSNPQPGILYGHGPVNGYTLFSHKSDIKSLTRMGTPDAKYQYPMGVCKRPEYLIIGVGGGIPTEITNMHEKLRADSVVYGGPHNVHYKINPNLYDQKVFSENEQELKKMIGMGSYIETSKLVPVGIYISSYDMLSLPFIEMLTYQPGYEVVRINKSHKFVQEDMMKVYNQYCSTNHKIKLIGELILHEDEDYIVLNRKYIDAVLLRK